ncbi:hypothetical protein DPMN_144125 [Dreissena polymorpha]|uniref:Uncharacterized protein n=1 Tax=Dreissena polymorpha TaxID=45954 RepID=A0A9D4GKG1_DREPO|nr:hypothetical protein DPMN_144125 [Dreissena polymorpha]
MLLKIEITSYDREISGDSHFKLDQTTSRLRKNVKSLVFAVRVQENRRKRQFSTLTTAEQNKNNCVLWAAHSNEILDEGDCGHIKF